MRSKQSYTLAILALLLFALASTAFADTPPSWAVGTFNGSSRKYNLTVELTIRSDGSAERNVWSNRNSRDNMKGNWTNGQVQFGSDRFYITRSGNGLRMVKEGDDDDVTDLRSGGYNGGGGRPDPSDRPPSWATGKFSGVSRKYRLRVDLSISSDGSAERTVWQPNGGGRDTARGSWRDGQVVFGRDRFNITRSGNGVRMVKDGDRNDLTDLKAGWPDEGDPGRPDNPNPSNPGGLDRPPSWAVGTFSGQSRKYDLDVEITIARTGSIERTVWSGRGSGNRSTGVWQDDQLRFGKDRYWLNRRGDSFRMVKVGDDSDITDLRSGRRPGNGGGGPGNGGGGADQPPDWLVGRFKGHSRKYDLDVELVVSRRGQAERFVWGENGRPDSLTGTWSNGKLRFGRDSYYVDRYGGGIRMVKDGDDSDVTEMRESGNNDNDAPGSGDRPPSWAVGRFRGRSLKYDLQVELTIGRNGSATRYVWDRSGKRDSVTGSWNDGKVTFGGDGYYLYRRGDGLRMVKVKDSSDETEFRRSGD
jgi:hypothetical protein